MNFKDKRILKDYYRSQNLIEPLAPRFIVDTVVFLILLLLFLWYIPSFDIAIWGIVILFGLMIFRRYSKHKKKYLQIKKACFQKIAFVNIKRLKTTPDIVLNILKGEISKNFRWSFKTNNGMLEGRLLVKNNDSIP